LSSAVVWLLEEVETVVTDGETREVVAENYPVMADLRLASPPTHLIS
jgi:hypothetical protein